MSKNNILIYILRRDLRVADNPILDRLATTKDHGFTHLLPIYIFPPHQMEVSGFIKDGTKSPFPEARSLVGRFWRCGPHRAKFIGESVWNLKESLEALGSGLLIRIGKYGDVVQHLTRGLKENHHDVGAVWMTSEEGVEESRDEAAVAAVCESEDVKFKVWVDEKYFIDDRELNFEHARELPDVFTTYRKSVEPLNEKPLSCLPRPAKSSLPTFPDVSQIPQQARPFTVPDDPGKLNESLVSPVKNFLPDLPEFPEMAESAHPFKGGETSAYERLIHLVQSEAMTGYKESRNGLIGTEFSTKLSAYLAQGCLTARQIHEKMAEYETGTNEDFKDVPGFGKGENPGTQAVRFELLWRDYMRLCTKKFRHKLFRLEGFRGDDAEYKDGDKKQKWKTADKEQAASGQDPNPGRVAHILDRFFRGTTGMGLIDASQRELLHTGYTSNRARQNVASFLAKHLGIDWRYGAEWYEMLLVDYDVSSNWANWQYVSGVGNDPRGEARIFNPVKQAFDYDKEGNYVRAWVPEVADLERLENAFQAWTASEEELKKVGLEDNEMVTDPIKRIEFSVEGKPRNPKRSFIRRRGNGRRPSQQTNGDAASAGTTNGGTPEQQQSEGGQARPPTQGQGRMVDGGQRGNSEGAYRMVNFEGGYRGNFRGGSRGGVMGGYRGGRGAFPAGRGGYRGRYVPGPGRPQAVIPAQTDV